jgi:hypothetical protein
MKTVASTAYMTELRIQVHMSALNTSAKFDQAQWVGHRSPLSAWSSVITAVRNMKTNGSRNMSASAITRECWAIQ